MLYDTKSPGPEWLGCPAMARSIGNASDSLPALSQEVIMNSRRIVLDTLEMRRHGRAPRDLWTLPWATKRYGSEIDALCRDFPMDFVSTPGFFREPCPGHGDPYPPASTRTTGAANS